MPISFKKMTIDNISDSTIIRMIRKICGIIDENNQNFSDAYDGTLETAQEAESKASEAKSIANEAKTVAYESNEISTNAESIAENAQTVANGIDAKATSALENSETALDKSNEALSIAENSVTLNTRQTITATKEFLGQIITKSSGDFFNVDSEGYIQIRTSIVNDVNDNQPLEQLLRRYPDYLTLSTNFRFDSDTSNYYYYRLESNGDFYIVIPSYKPNESLNNRIVATRSNFHTDPILMRTTGNQLTSGTKGFTSLYTYNNNLDNSVIPETSVSTYGISSLKDKNNQYVKSLILTKSSSGSYQVYDDYYFYNQDNVKVTIGPRLTFNPDGTGYYGFLKPDGTIVRLVEW